MIQQDSPIWELTGRDKGVFNLTVKVIVEWMVSRYSNLLEIHQAINPLNPMEIRLIKVIEFGHEDDHYCGNDTAPKGYAYKVYVMWIGKVLWKRCKDGVKTMPPGYCAPQLIWKRQEDKVEDKKTIEKKTIERI